MHRGDDIRRSDAERGRARLVDPDAFLRRAVLDRVVDAHDFLVPTEFRADALRHRVTSGLVGTIDFGDERREDRGAGRHFHHLDPGAEACGDTLELRAQGARDLMALAVALVLVHEVHLQIAVFRLLPQVVLAHEAVEVDGCRGAGVGLVVGHFGNRRDIRAHRPQHGCRVLDRSPGRHVDDDLQLRFVVEGQHFHHHPLECRKERRQHDGDQDRDPEPAPVASTRARIEERRQQCREPAREATIEARGTVRGGCADVREAQRQPRGERQRDAERDQHPHAGVDRDRRHVRSHQSADERHRQQRRDDRQRREDRRSADFVHGRAE